MASNDGWEEVPVDAAHGWEEVPVEKSGPAKSAAPGDIGPGATFGSHVARHLSFGLGDKITAAAMAAQDVLHDKTGKVTWKDAYNRDLAFNDKALEASDEANPKARWAGNAVGVAGSLAVPGGALRGYRLLRGAAAAAPALEAAAQASRLPLAALAKQGAATGATLGGLGGFGASRADNLGDAAVDTGVGVLMGGGAGGLLGAGVPAVARPLSGALRSASNKLAAKAVRGTAGEYKALGDEGVQEVGEWLHRNNAVRFGDTPASIQPRVEALRTSAGQAMDEALAKAASEGVRVNPAEYARRFEEAAAEAARNGPAAKPQVAKLLRAATQARKAEAELPWRFEGGAGNQSLLPAEAEAWKRGYQGVAYPKGRAPIDPSPSQVTDMEIARHAKEVTERALEDGLEGTSGADAFRAAKTDYGTATKLGRMLEGAEGRHTARLMTSPSDKAHFISHAAFGHPGLGMAAAAANHVAGSRAPASLAVTSRALSGLLEGAGEGVPLLRSEAALTPAQERTAALIQALRSRAQQQSLPMPTDALARKDSP